jgi:putative effector of murein hydrolase LrgA (UPF0299 family)
VNLPLLLADAAILHAYGFRIGAELPGLLWSQVLLTAGFVLPIAALSAVTTGFVQLLLTSLFLFLVAAGWSIAAPVASLGAGWGPLSGMDWIEFYYALVVVMIAALAILLWQYARRKTAASRSLAAIAVLLAVMGTMLIPWTTAFALQSRLSRQPIDQAAVRVGFDSARKWEARALIERGGHVWIEIPLQIAGIPDGMIVMPEGLTVTIEAPDGTVWRADQQPWTHALSSGLVGSLQATVDQRFYNKVKGQAVRFRGALYLTLFGNRRITDIPFRDRPVVTPGMGLCSASRGADGGSYFLVCSSAFRWPPALVSIRFVQLEAPTASLAQLARLTSVEAISYLPQKPISYSPFPAEFDIHPVSQYTAYTHLGSPSEASVATLEPLAHIHRDFDIGPLRLSDFEVRPAVP